MPATASSRLGELDVPQHVLAGIMVRARTPVSLSVPLSDDGDGELADIVSDPLAPSPFDAAAVALLPAEIANLLVPLTRREREVVTLRFGLDHSESRTLDQVGAHFDLSRERIRQIEVRAMAKLRHASCNNAALRERLSN
jgi:DNA-directed RNA polymerase sigma subunit (sigma70/sigma32)